MMKFQNLSDLLDALDSPDSLPRLPEPIRKELERIQKLEGEPYGLVFAVRDLYETVLKVICLAICVLIDRSGEDDFCRVLLSPKPMSMGDWLNDLPAVLKKSRFVDGHPEIRSYLKKLGRLYNSEGIVSWRNNFIGHGLMSDPEDGRFFEDAEKKINDLIGFLNACAVPDEILAVDFDHGDPFLYREADKDGEHYYIFESMLADGRTLYTDQMSRRRVRKENSFFKEKQKKYQDSLNVTQGNMVRNQDIYLSGEDESIDGYHLAPYYQKPEYMKKWVQECIHSNPGGIFLMKGGRGTGKSSFVLACDELHQHGDQKISLSGDGVDVAVRAYYCNRIDFSNVNDFSSYVCELLGTFPDATRIRSRLGNLPGSRSTLAEILKFYREQYERLCGKEKLVLFIDGIDELTRRGWKILDLLPLRDQIPDGVYLILTCRSETMEIPPLIRDFIENFPFTGKVLFDLKKENHELMVSILGRILDRSQTEKERIADVFDNRLSVIPLLLSVPDEMVLAILETAPTGQQADEALSALARSYLSRLRLRYGESYFSEFVRFFMTVSEALEGLTLSEASLLSSNQNVSLRTLCFLKDAAPFLTEFRSYRGNLYWLSRPEYKKIFREQYAASFRELLREWRELLTSIDTNGTYRMEEDWRDVLLYLCGNLAEMEAIFQIPPISLSSDEGIRLTEAILFLCRHAGYGSQLHRMRRALKGFRCIVVTLKMMMEQGRCEERIIDLFLESAADSVAWAVQVNEYEAASEMIKEISDFVEKHSELFFLENERRKIQMARFYMNAMLRFGSVYDTEHAQVYFDKAMAVLGQQDFKEYREKYDSLKNALIHNYLGMFRNLDPEKTLKHAELLLKSIEMEAPSFSKMSNYFMIGMCFRSAGRDARSEALFLDACDMAEALLAKQGKTFRQLLDPHEQEIYIHIYWRLAQTLHRRLLKNMNEVSCAELKIAIHTLDWFIDSLILVSQAGYGHFDFLRLDLMTTAALLRNMIAHKTARLPFRILKNAGGSVQTVEDYVSEAIQAAAVTEQAYASLHNAGALADRTDAVYNLMNCACVYSGCGDNQRALALLEKILSGYVPENEQEQIVFDTVKRKYWELKAL